jgi:transposase
MKTVTTIGLDIAKSVFQVRGIDAEGNIAIRKQLKRVRVVPFFSKLEPCVVGIEACASSHYWARELSAPMVCASDSMPDDQKSAMPGALARSSEVPRRGHSNFADPVARLKPKDGRVHSC